MECSWFVLCLWPIVLDDASGDFVGVFWGLFLVCISLVALSVVLDNVSNDFVGVFFGLLLVYILVVAWSFAFDEVSA